ncbi:transposase [Streptomyces sp. OV198]|uniref:IS110 family transposase n=1 Tax=Streptomyces sp. OV198 TaxID=1882787 RepID=UPI000BE30FAB|nr:transposase [Streptomyces sp. OV198]
MPDRGPNNEEPAAGSRHLRSQPPTPAEGLGLMFVGWDWASASHDVTVIDDRGIVIDHWAFQHSEDDFETALARLASHGTPAELPVIIERSSGLVVDRLLEAGYPVVPVHPTAFHAARPRWGASGAKSDPGEHRRVGLRPARGHPLPRPGWPRRAAALWSAMKDRAYSAGPHCRPADAARPPAVPPPDVLSGAGTGGVRPLRGPDAVPGGRPPPR